MEYVSRILDESGKTLHEQPISADAVIALLTGGEPFVKRETAAEQIERAAPTERVIKEKPISDEDAVLNERIAKWLGKGKEPKWVAEKVGCSIQRVNKIAGSDLTATRPMIIAKPLIRKGKQEERCTECHTTGSRHFKTCSKSEQRVESLAAFDGAREQPAAPKAGPLTPEEYGNVRRAMHDKEFMSGKYALSNKLSPREVNAAIVSKNYDEYKENRV